MILAGDIGGTKTNVALFEVTDGNLSAPMAQKSFPSGKYDSLDKILEEFIAENHPQVTHACFGIAGPVVEGRVETPNLAWIISDKTLAQTIGVERVGLINDLEATAHGIETLKDSQLFTLNEGEGRRAGHRGLIAAGTGLGMAGIFWDGQDYHPIASEGGHMDFAPRNEIEIELLRYLTEKFNGHVSYERALSGPGLFNIYNFLRDQNFAEEPDWLAAEINSGDKTAAVSKAALSGKSELAREALDMFVEIYGAMAGNLALLMKATGGLFIGGGIAPKLLDKLKDGAFMSAFKDKGRLSSLVASVPVYVILDDKTALYGAARCASKQRVG
ncbi:MAG: glucokinase [Acidobacteriota bacterium]|nr:glucokinase [Acidobacteriota bacterium]